MNNRNWVFLLVILKTLFLVAPGGCYRIPTLPDHCTCVTREGIIYSLWPLRRTDGRPRFTETGFQPHPAYIYSYNPCVPYTLVSKKGICENVALCKYNDDDQPVYTDIGEQRDVMCDINDGEIALIYPIQNPVIPTHESRVNLKCDNDSEAKPKFTLIDEDNMIFQITSYCGCPNKCLPTWPTKPGPNPSTTPASGTETPSSGPRSPSSQPEDRVVLLKETNRAFKHEEAWAKGKVNEPQQGEEKDVREEYSIAGKGDKTVLT